MKKLRLTIVFCMFAFIGANGQNLVPNPSFENLFNCPQTMAQLNFAHYWYSPSGNTPDLFNVCSPLLQYGVHIPKNVIGYQWARTGNGYGGVGTGGFTAGNPEGREYASSRLTDTLQQGKKYCVEFYVSLGDSCVWAIDRLGAFFSKDSLFNFPAFQNIDSVPQIETDPGLIYSDTTNWVKISKFFYASGGERFITIGNFHPDSNTATDSLEYGTWYTAYYYIDDVSVILCEDTIPEPPVYDSISLLPTLGDGHLQLKGNFPAGSVLRLYDAVGRDVGKISAPCGECTFNFFLPFAAGVYLYCLESAAGGN